MVPKVVAPSIPADMYCSRHASNPAPTLVSAKKDLPLLASAPTARLPPVAATNRVVDLTEAPMSTQAAAPTSSDQAIDLTDSVPSSPPKDDIFPSTAAVRVQI